jgi:hypothetical protein
MCVVSMVGDHYRDIWKEKPWFDQPCVKCVNGCPNAQTNGA